MKHRNLTAAVGVVVLCFSAAPQLRAQYTANFQTNIISGVTSNWSGDYYVGNTTFADVLLIQNGGLLANNSGIVGGELSNSNNVTVTGAGSVWSNSADLSVGSSGTINQVTINAGGLINCANGYIGNGLGNSNTLTVTGNGSAWNVANTLYVGWAAGGNALVASNGAQVTSNSGDLGHFYGVGPVNSGNKVLVSGTGSVWSNAGSLYVGNSGVSNSLMISNGGRMVNGGVAYVGYNSSSSNNSVLVRDSGSTWSNGSLYVGYNGFDNSLVVSNGAQVLNGAEAWVGAGVISRIGSNSVVVTGNSSVWSNGLDLSVGDPGSCNRVVVRNGGLLINNNGYVGAYAATSSNNSLVVSDTGSVWTNLGDVRIGDQGVGNSLTVSNGGNVFSGFGYVGYTGGTNGVVVTGSGSLWTNRNDLTIGNSGAGNSVAILNSGVVCNSIGYIGNNGTIGNNAVLVSDPVSAWHIVNGLYVGNVSAGNSLVISNGGRVVTGYTDSYLGSNASSSNNSAIVTGTGSIWSNNGTLYVGNSGAYNSLVISDGGQVINNYATVGESLYSTNNRVLVSGSGSVWNNSGELKISDIGSANSLIISNGGRVFDTTAYIGYASGSNTGLVTGAGSVWSNAFTLFIGFGGRSNALAVSNGGQVISKAGTGGGILITGTNSVWNTGTLMLGGSGMVISNGALMIDDIAYVSYNASACTARVANAASWRNNNLFVGYQGSANSVLVGGGSVSATNLVVGFAAPTCDNLLQLDSGSVIVTDATHNATLEVGFGAFIMNAGTLQVDTLVITNPCARFYHNGGTLIIGNLVLDPNLSATGDGIPNGWKLQYGFDPFDPNLANEDSDGDGMSNLQEYLAGTDPTNSASAFRITGIVRTNSSDVFVTWTTGLAKTNALQVTTNFPAGYSDIFTVTNTTGTVTNYLDPGAVTNGPSRYYRVRLVP